MKVYVVVCLVLAASAMVLAHPHPHFPVLAHAGAFVGNTLNGIACLLGRRTCGQTQESAYPQFPGIYPGVHPGAYTGIPGIYPVAYPGAYTGFPGVYTGYPGVNPGVYPGSYPSYSYIPVYDSTNTPGSNIPGVGTSFIPNNNNAYNAGGSYSQGSGGTNAG